jgi:uncharacterized membrane protein YhaH (DUF805 family)
MSWVLLLTSFTGSINRARFWLGCAINAAIFLGVVFFSGAIFGPDPLASQTTAIA